MLEQLWIKPNEKGDSKATTQTTVIAGEEIFLSKQLIFETDEIEKNLLKNAFKLVTSTFKIKGYQ